jgi:FkbM family methyltransferase
LDIGAKEGMFSILMAKMFPEARVVSFEPVPRTFFQMIRNIGLNGVTNIEALCLGVGKDEAGVMNVHKEFSGGSSLVDTFDPVNHDKVYVALMPLDEVVKKYGPIKLLKMDIEGGEHEALSEFQRWNDIESMVAEFHINQRLAQRGYDIEKLAAHVRERTNLLYFERCRMAD